MAIILPISTTLPSTYPLGSVSEIDQQIFEVPGVIARWVAEPQYISGTTASDFVWRDMVAGCELKPRTDIDPLAEAPDFLPNAVNNTGGVRFGYDSGSNSFARNSRNGQLVCKDQAIVGAAGYTIFVSCMTPTGGGGAVVGNARDSGPGDYFALSINPNSGALQHYHQSGEGTELQVSSSDLRDGVWKLFTASYDFTAKSLKIDVNTANIGENAAVNTEVTTINGGQYLTVGGVGATGLANHGAHIVHEIIVVNQYALLNGGTLPNYTGGADAARDLIRGAMMTAIGI